MNKITLMANQVHTLEEYIGNLRDQAGEWSETYHDLQVEGEALLEWLRANETVEHPNGLWVIDVRVGGISPEYDDKLDRYYKTEELKDQANNLYWELMTVVDRWTAADSA